MVISAESNFLTIYSFGLSQEQTLPNVTLIFYELFQ